MNDAKRTAIGILIFLIPLAVAIIWKLTADSTLFYSPEALIDPETRLRSYHKQWVKAGGADHSYSKYRRHFRNFESGHTEIRMIQIPVPDQTDIYLILRAQNYLSYTKTSPPWESRKTLFQFGQWKKWFNPPPYPVAAPPLETTAPGTINKKYVISLFDSNGKLMDETEPRPFNGNNLTELTNARDFFDDLNGDGWIERVSGNNCGTGGLKGTVRKCSVTRVGIPTRVLFEVAFSITYGSGDKYDWTNRCADSNGDGLYEIQLGPDKTPFVPEVTFFWNERDQTYRSQQGQSGVHFRVIEDWEDIEEILKTGSFAEPP